VTASGGEQREVCYSGRVQGVGFRYTVRWLAQRTGVTGFVKNLPDGRVQLVVEGPPAEVQLLLAQVRVEMGRYIAAAEEQSRDATGKFKSFEVRF
jgi:acylphosphatase